MNKKNKITVSNIEKVRIIGKKKQVKTKALFDTGASGNCIDYKLAARAGVGPVTSSVKVSTPFETKRRRAVVMLKLKIHGKIFRTKASLEDRKERPQKISIGRKLLHDKFIVEPKSKRGGKREKVGLVEKITLIGADGKTTALAKFDTGATYTSIDSKLAEKIGMKVKEMQNIKGSTGKEKRPAGKIKVKFRDRKIRVTANVTDRSHMTYPVLIGRTMIRGKFAVDVSLTHETYEEDDLKGD